MGVFVSITDGTVNSNPCFIKNRNHQLFWLQTVTTGAKRDTLVGSINSCEYLLKIVFPFFNEYFNRGRISVFFNPIVDTIVFSVKLDYPPLSWWLLTNVGECVIGCRVLIHEVL